MNALILISGLATGGAERVTVSFARRLAQSSVRAIVCTVTSRHDGPLARELEDAGIQRLDLGARRLADPRAPMRLRRILIREGIDIVHAHGQDAAVIGATVRRGHHTPLVVTRHVVAEPERNWRERLRARATLWAFRTADATVAVSAAAAERLAVMMGRPRDEIEVIYNGVDLQRFVVDSRADARTALRTELGWSSIHSYAGADSVVDEPIILLPAVLRPDKGHLHMLEALPRILERVPGARLVFAGAGEAEQALRTAARPFHAHVAFLGTRSDMPALYAAADVVVLPSLSEALPTALIEAAAAGRPCVATAVGGTSEVVEHGRTGLLVDAGSPDALAAAVIALLDDASRAEAMGQLARLRAGIRFGLDQQVARTVTLWERLVAQRSARHATVGMATRWGQL